MAVASAAVCGVALVALARTFPGLFLWVLGPQYARLQAEVVLVILSGAIGLIAGVMASINGSRRFIYYSFVLADIILTLILQAVYIWKVDLSTVKAVLWFNIVTMIPTIAVAILTALYGFARGGRCIAEAAYASERM